MCGSVYLSLIWRWRDEAMIAGGESLFRLACEHDLEGIVAKHRLSPYLPDAEPAWFKIRNRSYSQWVGREDLFERERERGVTSAENLWDSCVAACAGL